MAEAQGSLREAIKKSRILVVEDYETNRTLLENLLRNSGFTNLAFAGDGQQGLDMVADFRPDLILLDLMMPRMDGDEMLRRLRAMPEGAGIPVIVQTSADSPTMRNLLFDLGATDFIAKPINLREFLARVRIHLENRYLLSNMEANLTRLADELHDARSMQQHLLPDDPILAALCDHADISVRSHYQPCSELGGDLWGCRPCPDGSMLFHLFDVSGHGVSAALNSFRLHAFIDRLALGAPVDPGMILAFLNNQMAALFQRGRFATMVIAVLDRERRVLRYASAGSPGPIITDVRTGQITILDGSGLPLGIRRDTVYPTREVPLGEGRAILLYSDGLQELVRPDGSLVGEQGVGEAMASCEGGCDQLGCLVERLSAQSVGQPQDDLTAVCILTGPSWSATSG